MRVLFMGNNFVGYEVAKWLKAQGTTIVGAVLHPEHKRKYGDEILAVLGLPETHIFDGSTLRQPAIRAQIQALQPDVALSMLFGYILKSEFIELFPDGVVNLHPSYLPYNRGQYPNVWSIVERTPAGVTLHYVDAGIDTGDIIAQQQVEIHPTDTGESLYRRLERACIDVFKITWPALIAGKAPRVAQATEAGTYHRTRDVEKIDPIDLDQTYKARDLIDILRARTFPPYKGAYFEVNGQRVFMELRLYTEETDKDT